MNFRTSLLLTATLTLDINTDWSPVVDVAPDLTWTDNPKVEIVRKVWVDIRRHVEGKLHEKLSEMAQKLREAIPPDIVRREVVKAWRAHTLPITAPRNVPAFVHITPTSIGFTGLAIQDDQIRVGVMLKARTEISTAAATSSSGLPSLPALARVTEAPGKLAESVARC
jgi:hypothetical protein